MFRNRLKGGHRVGASTFQQNPRGQSALVQPSGGWGMPSQPYQAPIGPGQPPPPPPPQQPVQLQQAPNAAGCGNENVDNSWNWGETDPWSSNSNHGFNSQQHLNQQHQLSQQQHLHALSQQPSQPPVPQYNHQPQAYPQQLPPTSQQEQFVKPASNTVLNNQHADNNSGVYATSQSQQFSANSQQQYVNGNSQNGSDDWGNDNWGDDWSQTEVNKNNNKPANYGRQEQQYNQHQQQQQYQAQQQQYHAQQQYQQQHQHNYQQDTYPSSRQYEQPQTQEQQYKQQQQNIQHPQQYPVEQQNYYQQHYEQYNNDNKAMQQPALEQQQIPAAEQQPAVEQQQQPTIEQQQQPAIEQQQQPVVEKPHHPVVEQRHQPVVEQQQQQAVKEQQQPAVEQQQQPAVEQQQQDPMQSVPATEADAWGWGNDNWDASRKEEPSQIFYEQQQSHQPLVPQPERSDPQNTGVQEVIQEHQADPELSSLGNDFSQKAVNRDTAGDGWPDWESGDQQQQQQVEITQAAEDQSLLTGQSVLPTEPERLAAQLEGHEEPNQMHQGNHQWDDGLEHQNEPRNDTSAAVATTDRTNYCAAVSESGQFMSSSDVPTHSKQDSWGWDTTDLEVRLDDYPRNVPVSENDAAFKSENSADHHDNLQGPTELTEQVSHKETEATSTNQHASETIACISRNEEDPTPGSAAPGLAMGETWDDDGWGDGWEAEGAGVQEAGTSEKEDSGENQQHQDSLQQPANFNSASNHSPRQTEYSCGNIDIQQQSYHPETAVMEAYQYGQEKANEDPQDVGQQESSCWGNSWNEDVPVDPSSEHVKSSEALESVTQGFDSMSLGQKNKNQPSSTYDHYGHTGTGESAVQAQHFEVSCQYSGYEMQPGVYHMPQGDAQSHPHWPTNQGKSEQENESQHNVQYPRTRENTNRSVCDEEMFDIHSQSGHEVSPVTEKLNSHTGVTQSTAPPTVPSPGVDNGNYSNPDPVLSPHPSTTASVSTELPELQNTQLQDPVHHYTSFQTNQQHAYHQYQGLNQEVIDEPEQPTSELPDPMVSRIPDGASSVSEISARNPVATETGSQVVEEPQGDARHSLSEMIDRPSSTQSAQSITPQPNFLTSQSVHPSTAHSYPERPASNQSAHSVHSVRSSHSVHSAYSNRSTQSSHSLLSQNQEVPSGEELKMPTLQPNMCQAISHDQAAESLSSGNVQNTNSKATPPLSFPADGSIDPTAPPTNNPVAPPPKSVPLGSVTSLRPRKGSPFQPPSGKPPQTAVVSQGQNFSTSRANSGYSDTVSANLEMTPDNNEQPLNAETNAVPLWTSSENLTSNVKLAVAAPSIETVLPGQPSQETSSVMSDGSVSLPSSSSKTPLVLNNPIPLVVPGMVKDEHSDMEPSNATVNPPQATWMTQPDPPVAHNIHTHSSLVMPKMQPQPSTAPPTATPGALDLSRSSRSLNEPRGDGSQNKTETPNFSRMVPGESSKGESASSSTYQAPTVVPSMPSERVVTGNDNPQPVLPVRIKQEPNEVRSPPDGPYTSDLSGQGASVIPPVRSETIGSEEPTSRNFTSANSGSRPDLTNDHRSDRGGRWERDQSRDRDSRSGDRYRDRSRERNRDYYRDDSPHSRRSYDRDYDYKYDSDRRMWRHESEDDEDGDRRYYESRDRRDRAYRDELDRYSDRPIKEEKDRSHRESSRDKRRDYRDRSRDYRSYDDDPYFGRSDRSQPVSRSSSINNLDNEGDRSGHSHRSRHDYYDRHDRRDSRSRDSDHRDREGPYSRNRERDLPYTHDGREGRDARRDPRYYGQRGYDETFGSRDVYDQYHYYYQYYQGHPYYKEYYRQWMKQYGHAYQSHESFYDDRTSIHSGRSSVNDELKKSISSQFMQDFHGRSSVGPYEPSAIYPDGSYSQLKSYASGELSGVPSVGGDSATEAPQRLTPVQHGLPHINAQFTPGGQLLLVLPKDPRDGDKAIVQLRDVQKMLSIDPTLNRCIWQLKSYPGPLTLADTHKDVVIRYCEQQAAAAAKNRALPDGESVTLIWEYLALLVKQNGKLYGSDVAGLLLKGQDKSSQPQHSASNSSPEDDAEVSSSDGSPQDEGIDMQLQSPPLPPPRDEQALLKKFTEYLCLGRKKEAVDYAMREGLWGHALALSYKMDSTTHTRVLAAFSNSIPRNDVLLTLFQQLSGKRPEVAKNYTPQQWGNWRQHLAMMISNPTGQSQRDKASVVALGETLASRGQLHAAHFCYLVAEAEWGSFSNKESKLVLIGSSHHLPFQAFATNEAIQCTEIYEFARSLDASNPVLEKFQSYKLIYALRLAEYGFPSEALRYCEVISQIVSKDPHTYQGDFLAQVYELSLRLKYHDLHYQMYEGEVAEIPDPQWVTNLASLVTLVRLKEKEENPPQSSPEYQSNTQNYVYQGASTTPDLYSQNIKTADSYSLQYGVVDSPHHQGQATPDLNKGPPVSAEAVDGGYHQQLIPTYPVASGSSNEGLSTQVVESESGQSMEGSSHAQVGSSPQPESVPMVMQPQQNQYGGYGTNYWPGYTQPDAANSSQYISPESADASHSSLPASPVPSISINSYTVDSEVSNEQRSNSATSMTQPHSLGSYPPYQQPYQPWDQQQQTLGSSSGTDQPQSLSPEPPHNSNSQRSAEEEAYWAEMTGKKDDEYDEFGGDLYEYEDIEEVGARESDTEVDYQLRHRHPTSLVSNQEPLAVTSTIPTSQQQPPSLQPIESSESVQDSLCQNPEFLGSTTTTTATLSPSLESSTSSMALPNSLPMFQPLPQHSSLLSSPLPPPLGLNSHVTQKSNEGAEPTLKEKENSEDSQKSKEKESDPSQEKSTGWSIGSLFRWKTNTKQAVLPDDKNPSIVWNEEKKRWENKDGEEEVNNPPPPPPKSSLGGPGAPPMFLTRAGPRKSRYVNTEKDSSKQPLNGPNPLLNPLNGGPPISGGPMSMPGGAPPPPSFMVPGPVPEGNISPQQPSNMQHLEQQQQQQPPQQPLSQVPPTSLPDSSLMRRSRYISESSIELEEDWPPTNPEGTSSDGVEGPVPMMAPPGQPQFFNPSQFNPTAPSNPAQTRRVGPGKRLYQGKR
ncbi:protein transport protein Sec16A-like isoform X3 [Palaemon carinicauda]|uniref:protein transport protein Sec16A-like isoform X3 n=1 Tax=Palaemon carinicauda TaxID=392227 RepID=UPI0035B65AC8